MTDEQLKEIEARAEKATAGPWTWDVERSYADLISTSTPRTILAGRHDGNFQSEILRRPDDSSFIAHARTDVPALIAEVKRLRAVLEKIANANADWSGDVARQALEGINQ